MTRIDPVIKMRLSMRRIFVLGCGRFFPCAVEEYGV